MTLESACYQESAYDASPGATVLVAELLVRTVALIIDCAIGQNGTKATFRSIRPSQLWLCVVCKGRAGVELKCSFNQLYVCKTHKLS